MFENTGVAGDRMTIAPSDTVPTLNRVKVHFTGEPRNASPSAASISKAKVAANGGNGGDSLVGAATTTTLDGSPAPTRSRDGVGNDALIGAEVLATTPSTAEKA